MDAPRPFFRCDAVPGPTFSGYGLVIGMNAEGEPQDISVWCEYLCPGTISFPNVRYLGLCTTEREENHPIFGKVSVIERKALFEEIK